MDSKNINNALIGLAIGTTVLTIPGGILYLAGFKTGGVVAGSAAAVIHSKIGIVSAGSIFSYLQSLGAAGIVFTKYNILSGIIGSAVNVLYGSENKKYTMKETEKLFEKNKLVVLKLSKDVDLLHMKKPKF